MVETLAMKVVAWFVLTYMYTIICAVMVNSVSSLHDV